MNFLAKILLVIFIFAQSAPSLLSIIDEDSSIDLVEDDQKAKEDKQYKSEFIFTEVKTPHVFALKKPKEINTNYLIKEYSFFSSINILPPEQV
jgi:thioredoxin-related protein